MSTAAGCSSVRGAVGARRGRGARGREAVRREPGAPPFTARGRRPHPGYAVTPLRSYGATCRSFLFCFNTYCLCNLIVFYIGHIINLIDDTVIINVIDTLNTRGSCFVII